MLTTFGLAHHSNCCRLVSKFAHLRCDNNKGRNIKINIFHLCIESIVLYCSFILWLLGFVAFAISSNYFKLNV